MKEKETAKEQVCSCPDCQQFAIDMNELRKDKGLLGKALAYVDLDDGLGSVLVYEDCMVVYDN